MRTEINVNDGKYTVVMDGGNLSALRYGEPWQDLTGDNLTYWLAIELEEAREKLIIATEALKVYADIGNWKSDFNELQNIWHEPDSYTPFQYDGYNAAVQALKDIE